MESGTEDSSYIYSYAYRTNSRPKTILSFPSVPSWHADTPEAWRRVRATPLLLFASTDPTRRKVTFIDKEGQEHTFLVADGDNLLDIAQANDLEMEGACGGSCACSTCHVIVESDHYNVMEEPSDDENDMLDLAFGLTDTSRLGCQVHMSKELDGLVVKLPRMTRNLQASDFDAKS
jgi:ferredoxin